MEFINMLAHMTSFQKGTATDLVNEKERNLLIEMLEGGEKVSLYSPHFKGAEYSEFEKFLLTYKDTYPDDVRQLVDCTVLHY